MRHRSKERKFSRSKDERKALLRTLAVALISKKSIESTLPKCKSIRPVVEKLVTIARDNTLSARRLLLSKMGNVDSAVSELMKLAANFKDRPGGYTRIIKAGFRYGDNAPMGIIQFVDHDVKLEAKKQDV